jgi:recombination protein RecR
MNYPQSLINTIEQFKALPGIGPKSAERIALHLLKADSESVNKLAASLIDLKNKIRYCNECSNLSENDLCDICNSSKRETNVICIVETPRDLQAIEKTRRFNGLYHVLLGKISPLDGIGPEHLKIKELIKRIEKQKPQEIIIATSADVEGEATALYLVKLLKPAEIKITRIAYGIPVGTALELADEITLTRSLEGRQIFA